MDHNDEQVAQTFAALATVVHARTGMADVCQAVVDAAPYLVEGCDHASLMIVTNGKYDTLASSDPVAQAVDRLERELGEGPCVDAIEDEAYQLAPDITADCPWPRLAVRVVATSPVRGMAGYRLLIDGRKAGALNLFADRPGALTGSSANTGAVLAAFASVALMGAAEHDRAESTARGLESNREIGKAIGLLMAAHQISSDEAFEMLRTTSSHLNLKLALLARRLIEQNDAARD